MALRNLWGRRLWLNGISKIQSPTQTPGDPFEPFPPAPTAMAPSPPTVVRLAPGCQESLNNAAVCRGNDENFHRQGLAKGVVQTAAKLLLEPASTEMRAYLGPQAT